MESNVTGRIGFIGCGSLGSALIEGITRHDLFPAKRIYVYDRDPEKMRLLPAVQHCASPAEVVFNAGTIFLCVKPTDVRVAMLRTNLRDKALVSMCAGLSATEIRRCVPGSDRIMRVMTNLAIRYGQGATAYAVPNSLHPLEMEQVLMLFRGLGTVQPCEEENLDAVTAICGSAPAYFMQLMDTLINSGADLGLEKFTAMQLVTQTAIGAAELIRQSDIPIEQMIEQVSSGGGTTEAAMEVLKRKKLRDAYKKAVDASVVRAQEIADQVREDI